MGTSLAGPARAAFSDLVEYVRQLALSFRDLENDLGNPAEMTIMLTALEANTELRTQITNLISFEKNANVMNSISLTRVVADVVADYALVNTEDWIGGVTFASIAANATDFTNGGLNSIAQTAQVAGNSQFFKMLLMSLLKHFWA
jgi:hypothetical protein